MYGLAVVGARGFLGSALMRHAADHQISAIPFNTQDPAVVSGELHPGIGQARAVVWCASRVNPRLATEHPQYAQQDLADFTEFLDLIEELPSQPRVILLSSGGTVYGPPAVPPFTEADAPAPVNEYGLAKRALEVALAQRELDGVTLRIANAYGPGQLPAPGQAVLAHWMTAVRQHQPLYLYGDLEATRDYVFVDDVTSAIAAAASVPALPPVLNIGSGQATTLEQLLDALREAVAPSQIDVERAPARSTDTSHSVLNPSLAKEVLGWEPAVLLHQGVAKMWDWFKP